MNAIQRLGLLMVLVLGLVYAQETTKENPQTGGNTKESDEEETNDNGTTTKSKKESKTTSASPGLTTSLLGLGAILAICLAK